MIVGTLLPIQRSLMLYHCFSHLPLTRRLQLFTTVVTAKTSVFPSILRLLQLFHSRPVQWRIEFLCGTWLCSTNSDKYVMGKNAGSGRIRHLIRAKTRASGPAQVCVAFVICFVVIVMGWLIMIVSSSWTHTHISVSPVPLPDSTHYHPEYHLLWQRKKIRKNGTLLIYWTNSQG